jgi:hypothetical protein
LPLDNLPVHVPQRPKKQPRRAALRAWWTAAWAEGGVLYRRWDDVFKARTAGWHDMATWIKATLALTTLALVIALLDTATDVVITVLQHLATTLSDAQPSAPDAPHGLGGVIDNPVHSYINQHSAGLSVSPAALYLFWQLTGVLGLIGGFAGNVGARITWVLWGCATVAMVWAASPAGGRTVAAGLAALMWALASIVALRGLTLQRVIVIDNYLPEFRPELHLHATIPAPAGDGGGEKPDTTHPFQR